MPFGRQDPQHDGFVARDERYDCRQCIRRHADRVNAHERTRGATEDVFPPLDAENETAWALYQQIEDQVVIGMDVVGLNYGVLRDVFDFTCIADDPDERRVLFDKLVILNRAAQQHRALEREREKSRKAEAQSQRVANG